LIAANMMLRCSNLQACKCKAAMRFPYGGLLVAGNFPATDDKIGGNFHPRGGGRSVVFALFREGSSNRGRREWRVGEGVS
jgi:hypothetical protein